MTPRPLAGATESSAATSAVAIATAPTTSAYVARSPAGLRGDATAPVLLRRRRLDDHAARTLPEHRLECAAEAAARARHRHHDRIRLQRLRLIDDPPAHLTGSDLLPMS